MKQIDQTNKSHYLCTPQVMLHAFLHYCNTVGLATDRVSGLQKLTAKSSLFRIGRIWINFGKVDWLNKTERNGSLSYIELLDH